MVSKVDLAMAASLAHVGQQLGTILKAGKSPFIRVPHKGLVRGIDFYPASEMVVAAARAAESYRRAHGEFPNLLAPKGFNERIVRAKFFRPMKVPECGNKLLTKSFLPSRLSGRIRCARLFWHSPEPHLPPNEALPPGDYFLKSSHGSRMNRRVTYPLTQDARSQLETLAARWLSTPYGRRNGEWWYSCFTPEILIEEYLGEHRFSFNFFCFHGKVALIVLHNHDTSETITLSPELRLLGRKNGVTPVRRICPLPRLIELRDLAGELGAKFDFVRIDFFLTDALEAILGEMTFSPGSGLSHRPEGVDELLGTAWANAGVR